MLNALKYNGGNDIEFNIIGQGNQKDKMEKFVTKNKLSNVFFHGFQKELSKFYEETDLSISITDNAGFGISVLDSMFFNKPSIISKNSASFEIYNDHNYKFSIKTDNSIDELVILLKNLKNLTINDHYNYNKFYKTKYSSIIFTKTIQKYSHKLLNDN